METKSIPPAKKKNRTVFFFFNLQIQTSFLHRLKNDIMSHSTRDEGAE